MARERNWWTDTAIDTGAAPSGVRDVLSGSGLAVAGATLSRALGSLHTFDVRDTGVGLPNMLYGLKVAATAAATDLAPANINAQDWVWLQRITLNLEMSGTTQVVVANGRDPEASWDAQVQRSLDGVETLWLVWQIEGATMPGVRNCFFSRALVLAPA